MEQRERLAICNGCVNRKLDYELGYVCRLTGRFAEFEGSCKHYVWDQSVIDTIKVRTEDRPFVPLFDPPPAPEQVHKKRNSPRKNVAARKPQPRKPVPRKAPPRKPAPGKTVSKKPVKQKASRKEPSIEVIMKLRKYQSFLYALIGGLLITASAAVGWAFASAMTGFKGVDLALGMGLLVGVAIRFFGAGVKKIFGVLAALLTLAGSLLGYYLSQVGFLEDVQLARVMDIPGYLKMDLMFTTMRESFVPLDLLIYSLAALLAYLLAIRRISSMKMTRLEHEAYKGAPALYWLRLPLILLFVLLPILYGYTLSKEHSSAEFQTFFYESGEKMSEGEMLDGQEAGQWTSWHENGNMMSTGYYQEGLKDSLWMWYDESGVLAASGSYDKGMEQGTWMHYYADGVLADSGSYQRGLQDGLWEYFHENGKLKSQVNYHAGKMHGEKTLISPSGKVVNVDYYENGVLVDRGN